MQHITLLALYLSAATSASLLGRQVQCSDYTSEDCLEREAEYLEEVCMPTNATGYPDFNAPCVAAQAITAECIYGAAGLSELTGGSGNDPTQEEPAMLSNSTQRDCICESQFFAETLACEDCYEAHGATDEGYVAASVISSISSQYCAVTNTPTLGLADVLYSYATATSQSSSASADTSSFLDPIGNKTAVSYYFTPSVTGSAAYIVAQATESASTSGIASGSASSGSGSSLSTSLHTSDGQIVATASASAVGSASGTGSASGSAATASTTGSSGAGRQEAAAMAGVIALAGFVVMV
ncbi:hypothetical protein LTR85_009399 [Meristemomyces frigidus]|nr:hypothetical protein LTR85_009399 [Meristemomyces frigidus]